MNAPGRVRTPFAALVLERSVSAGSQVSEGQELGRLVGLDHYWVTASLRMDQLPYVEIPQRAGEAGSAARIRSRSSWPEQQYREGRLVGLIGELDRSSRLAKVNIEVSDPLGLNSEAKDKPALMLGSIVEVSIEGRALDHVVRPPDEHDMTAAELIDLWRNEIGEIPGVYQMTFEAESGPGGWRKDIAVDLSHDDVEVLERAMRAFVERAESFTNAVDVSDNFNRGKKQIDFTLRPEGRALGLTPEWVGQQVRDAFYGSLALRQMRGTNEVEIRVKLPRHERQVLSQLENLILRTPDGLEVPLWEVVEIQYGEAFTSIQRRDGRRIVTVSMDAEPKRTIGQLVQAFDQEILPELRANFPGLTWQFEGSTADMQESMQSLTVSFALAMLAIYALLALAFGNYVQTFIVLVAIPFGAIGAVLGHMILGYDLSLISLMGMIALAGVVVNDSLIMVDYANRRRSEHSAFDAIHQAGIRRFRPIVLTTLTTAGGLIPIIAERSLQAQYLIPMAISLGFGIVFGTAIILLLVPCLYLILDDLKMLVTRRKHA